MVSLGFNNHVLVMCVKHEKAGIAIRCLLFVLLGDFVCELDNNI